MTGPVPDTGAADLRLQAALDRGVRSPGDRAELLAALAGARIFVPLAARATGTPATGARGLPAESGAAMAVVLLESAGRRALPVFADVPGLLGWREGVRPVRLSAPEACAAALAEGADAVLLDPSGAAVVLAGTELRDLAAGWVPVPGSVLAVRRAAAPLSAPPAPPDPALAGALAVALAGEPLVAARLLDGPDGPVLGVAPVVPLDPSALAGLAARVVRRLGPALPADGLDLAVVPAQGPGVPVLPAAPRPGWLRRRSR